MRFIVSFVSYIYIYIIIYIYIVYIHICTRVAQNIRPFGNDVSGVLPDSKKISVKGGPWRTFQTKQCPMVDTTRDRSIKALPFDELSGPVQRRVFKDYFRRHSDTRRHENQFSMPISALETGFHAAMVGMPTEIILKKPPSGLASLADIFLSGELCAFMSAVGGF